MSFDLNLPMRFGYLIDVSIPFEQGDVFRRIMVDALKHFEPSQSLSSRAMSFDLYHVVHGEQEFCLNPFRAGRCLSTNKPMLTV